MNKLPAVPRRLSINKEAIRLLLDKELRDIRSGESWPIPTVISDSCPTNCDDYEF
jgi:hypothetical protein